MATREEFWILNIPRGESRSWALNITEPFDSLGEAERRIRWMKIGSGEFDTWIITTFDPTVNAFVTSGGSQYFPLRGGYTKEAWGAFKARTGYRDED